MPKVFLTQAARDAEKVRKVEEAFWKSYRVAKAANEVTDLEVAELAGFDRRTIGQRKHRTNTTTVGELRAMAKLNLLTLETVGLLLGLGEGAKGGQTSEP